MRGQAITSSEAEALKAVRGADWDVYAAALRNFFGAPGVESEHHSTLTPRMRARITQNRYRDCLAPAATPPLHYHPSLEEFLSYDPADLLILTLASIFSIRTRISSWS